MIMYTLNKDINGQKLLEDIQKMVQNKLSQTSNTLVLVIDIKEVVQDSDAHIPKITYNGT